MSGKGSGGLKLESGSAWSVLERLTGGALIAAIVAEEATVRSSFSTYSSSPDANFTLDHPVSGSR